MPSVLYDIGDTVTVRAHFTDAAGDDKNPTSVTFTISNPHGTTTAYVYGTDVEVVRDSTGHDHMDVTFDVWGLWRWLIVGAGVVSQSEQGTWTVRQTPLA